MKTTCYATPQDHDLMRGFMTECRPTVSAAAGKSGNNRPFFCRTYVKVASARHADGEGERWADESVSPTINLFDCGDSRSVVAIVKSMK